MEEDNVEQLRSNHSVERVCVKFVNLTNRVVEVIWVNYSGLFQRYTLLRKRQHVDINTFKTHPWIAVDVDTKDRMTLNNSFVYQPVPLKEFYENRGLIYPVLPEERRFVVYINLPVYSLRYRTLLEIRDLLKKPEEAEKLDLPHSLIVDLKKVITLKDKINIILPQ